MFTKSTIFATAFTISCISASFATAEIQFNSQSGPRPLTQVVAKSQASGISLQRTETKGVVGEKLEEKRQKVKRYLRAKIDEAIEEKKREMQERREAVEEFVEDVKEDGLKDTTVSRAREFKDGMVHVGTSLYSSIKYDIQNAVQKTKDGVQWTKDGIQRTREGIRNARTTVREKRQELVAKANAGYDEYKPIVEEKFVQAAEKTEELADQAYEKSIQAATFVAEKKAELKKNVADTVVGAVDKIKEKRILRRNRR